GKAAEAAGDRHDQHGRESDAHPGIGGGVWIGADRSELEADGGPEEEPPDPPCQEQGEDEPSVETQRRVDPVQQLRQAGRGKGVAADRIEPSFPDDGRLLEQVVDQAIGDEVEHERRDHLVGAGLGTQPAGDAAPDGAADEARQDRQRQVHDERQPGEHEPDQDGRHAADGHLAFHADVEQAGPEPECDRQTGDDQAGRGGQRLRDGVDPYEGASEECQVGGEDIVGPFCEDDYQGTDDERREHGEERHEDDRSPVDVGGGDPLEQRAARPWAAAGDVDIVGGGELFFLGHATCPAMYKPSSAGVVSAGVVSATILPRYMTRIRSDNARISSSSEETIRTADPSSRSSTIRRWMYSIDPTSTPLVGCEETISAVSRANSRATMSFCWLPPERWEASTSTEGVRTSYWVTSSSACSRAASQSITMPRL